MMPNPHADALLAMLFPLWQLLIGVLVAWLVSRGRGKMKLPFTGKNWLWVIIVVFVVLAVAGLVMKRPVPVAPGAGGH